MCLCGVYVCQSVNVDSCLFNQSPGCQHSVSHHWKLSLAPVGEGGKANEKPISQLVTGGRPRGRFAAFNPAVCSLMVSPSTPKLRAGDSGSGLYLRCVQNSKRRLFNVCFELTVSVCEHTHTDDLGKR